MAAATFNPSAVQTTVEIIYTSWLLCEQCNWCNSEHLRMTMETACSHCFVKHSAGIYTIEVGSQQQRFIKRFLVE